jgi:hypothetical protein
MFIAILLELSFILTGSETAMFRNGFKSADKVQLEEQFS